MIKRIRSLILLSLIAAAALVAFWLMAGRPSQAQSDQGILASLISRLLSTPTTQVTIGSIEGALSSNAVIRDIRIADKDGVWLNLDRARLVWSRTALLRGRLQVDELTVDRLQILRRPLPADEAAPVSDEPILPELPVRVIIDRFALQELVLGEPILGTAARLSAQAPPSSATRPRGSISPSRPSASTLRGGFPSISTTCPRRTGCPWS